MECNFLQIRKRNTEAWQQWAEQYFRQGYDVSHLSFVFDPMGTSERAIVEGMKKAVGNFYSAFVTRFNKWPTKPSRTHLNPSLIWFPDRPDAKSKKVAIEEAKINGLLHGHGITVASGRPQTSECDNTYDVIERDQAIFCRNGIMRIDAERITHSPRSVASYALKSYRAGYFEDDDFLAFPRTLSELTSEDHKPLK